MNAAAANLIPLSPFATQSPLGGALPDVAVTPLDEATLKQLRPRLAMSAARAAGDNALADLGVGFGLHPGFSALLPFWQERRLAIVHAVGSPDPTRSHFDAQDYMETGTPGRKGTPSGWLNRAVGLLGHDRTPFRAVAMTPLGRKVVPHQRTSGGAPVSARVPYCASLISSSVPCSFSIRPSVNS